MSKVRKKGGRPKGGVTTPTLLLDMRAVWKGGSKAIHTTAVRCSLHEMMVNNADRFLKQLREMEAEHEKRKQDHAAKKKESESAKVSGPALAMEPAEVKADELMNRLLSEWKGSR